LFLAVGIAGLVAGLVILGILLKKRNRKFSSRDDDREETTGTKQRGVSNVKNAH
jgi:hypothetical protein